MRTACLVLASLSMLASAIVLYYLCSRAMGSYSSPQTRAVYADAALPAAILFGTGLMSFTLCALIQGKDRHLIGERAWRDTATEGIRS